jgi:hypothetical protein
MCTHLEALDMEIMQRVEYVRQGQILTSIPGIGQRQAAIFLALPGTIASVERPVNASLHAIRHHFGARPILSTMYELAQASDLSGRLESDPPVL